MTTTQFAQQAAAAKTLKQEHGGMYLATREWGGEERVTMPYTYGSKYRPLFGWVTPGLMRELDAGEWEFCDVPGFPHGGLRTEKPLSAHDCKHFDLVLQEGE